MVRKLVCCLLNRSALFGLPSAFNNHHIRLPFVLLLSEDLPKLIRRMEEVVHQTEAVNHHEQPV